MTRWMVVEGKGVVESALRTLTENFVVKSPSKRG